MLDARNVRRFFDYARLRETIRLDREAGKPGPWAPSHSPLRRYSFCNVFREDDRTTRWFRDNIRDRYRDDAEMAAWCTFVFRWFNRVETGELLLKHNLIEDWTGQRALHYLRGVNPIVTGAYMVKTPPDMSKLDGVVKCIELARQDGVHIRASMARSLQECHLIWQDAPYIGKFVAYELVTDMRHTCVLEDAPDIDTWASPGPGAARGLDRLAGDELRTRRYSNPYHFDQMLAEMRYLLDQSCYPTNWPSEWRRWELREVEHTLCEYDKLVRTELGEGKPKGRFRPKSD